MQAQANKVNEMIYSGMQNYSNAISALQIRLDTKPIIDDIEMFLTGKKTMLKETENGIETSVVELGKARANQLGCQNILNFVTSIFNTQVVQGNYTPEIYQDYIFEIHESLLKNIMVNQIDWEIEDNAVDPIIDFIMNIAQPFLSRLIDDKERQSYTQTIKSIESNTVQTTDKTGSTFRG